MMSCSQLLKRLMITHRHYRMGGNSSILIGPRSRIHHDSKKPITGFLNKVKDTILVLEATKGPGVKAACGVEVNLLGQGAAAAALVFGTGCGALTLTNYVNPKIPKQDDPLIGDKHSDADELSKATSQRIALTYLHMVSSILASSFTALLSFRMFRNRAMIIRMGERPLVAIGLGVVTPLAMAAFVRYLPPTPTKEGQFIPLGLKEFGNLIYAGTIGLLAAPLYLLGGQSIHRAISVTAGTWLGLQGLAHYAPKDAFSNWGTPIACALNAVLLSFIITILMRRDHAAFNPLFRLAMHGGILAYSAHYCYTANAIKEAAKSSTYDPVNAAMSLTMDLLSLYGRFAFLLPPHFQLSRDHQFVVKGTQPTSAICKNRTHDESSYKPGNDDMS